VLIIIQLKNKKSDKIKNYWKKEEEEEKEKELIATIKLKNSLETFLKKLHNLIFNY
jgi:hypothetical protein